MKDSTVQTGLQAAVGDSTNIFEIMGMIAHYQQQAEYARKKAREEREKNSIVPFLAEKLEESDAGAEYELKATEWQEILETVANAKREALGMKPLGITPTTIVDEKCKEVKANVNSEKKDNSVETKEETKAVENIINVSANTKLVRQILTLWRSKTSGIFIMDLKDDTKFAEVTEKDEKNKYFVIENRHIDGKEIKVKRLLHSKEHAALLYTELEQKIDKDAPKLSNAEIKIKITALHAKDLRDQKQSEKISIDEGLDTLGLKTVRNFKTSFTGDDIIKRAGKFIEGDTFNMLILAGTDDSSQLSSEDQVKLKAIQLTAIGAKKEAVSLVYTYFKDKEGMTKAKAEAFIHLLMRENPYEELEKAIKKVFEYHIEKSKDYTKGIPMVKNLLKSYTRSQKVDEKGILVFESIGTGKKIKSVPVYQNWKESKINTFIDRQIAALVDKGIITLPEKTKAKNELSTEKKEKTSDDVSPSKEIKTETTQKKEKEASSTKDSTAKSLDKKTTEKSEKEESPAKTVPELILYVTANSENTIFTAKAENVDFSVSSKKVGSKFQKIISGKFKKFLEHARKHNEKCNTDKTLTPMAIPKGFEEGFNIGDPFTIFQHIKFDMKKGTEQAKKQVEN